MRPFTDSAGIPVRMDRLYLTPHGKKFGMFRHLTITNINRQALDREGIIERARGYGGRLSGLSIELGCGFRELRIELLINEIVRTNPEPVYITACTKGVPLSVAIFDVQNKPDPFEALVVGYADYLRSLIDNLHVTEIK